MFDKFKKAYISIEVVILASIVIIGGLCGLSAFLKNGQNAQSQSAEAMNNVIDMIGEEFDFGVGGGELPGGGNLPDDDSYAYELYFGKEYRYYDNGILTGIVKFYEDGGAYAMQLNTYAEPGRIVYNNKEWELGMFGGTIADDGLSLMLGDDVPLTMTKMNGSTQSPELIYYGAEYTGVNNEGITITIIGYEDGSGVLLAGDYGPAGTLEYQKLDVYDMVGAMGAAGSKLGTFSSDGTQFTTTGGWVYTLIE